MASLALVGVEASRRLAVLEEEPQQAWQEAVWLLRRVVPEEQILGMLWQPIWRPQVCWMGVVPEQALQVRALPLQVWLGVQPSSPRESLCREPVCSERWVGLRYRRTSADCGSFLLRSH